MKILQQLNAIRKNNKIRFDTQYLKQPSLPDYINSVLITTNIQLDFMFDDLNRTDQKKFDAGIKIKVVLRMKSYQIQISLINPILLYNKTETEEDDQDSDLVYRPTAEIW